jgi:hypothetical protein
MESSACPDDAGNGSASVAELSKRSVAGRTDDLMNMVYTNLVVAVGCVGTF